MSVAEYVDILLLNHKMAPAWKRGYNDHGRGQVVNPYRYTSDSWWQWNEGWGLAWREANDRERQVAS